MDELVKVDEQSFIQKWVAWIVGIILAGVIGLYLSHFHEGWSVKQDVWGQFGDFVGGLVNPVVGFFTILLLSVSLRQNQRALAQARASLEQGHVAIAQSVEGLKQSRNELELTRKSIEQATSLQAATEKALTEQIEVAEQAKDLNNATSLWTSLLQQKNESDRRLKSQGWSDNDPEFAKLVKNIGEAIQGMAKLERIMKTEIDRLDKKYNSSS